MIVDALKNRKQYELVHKHFAKAFDFLEKAKAENLPLGRYDLEGEEVYALVKEYTTKPREDGKPEGHRKYIDIQYVLEGTESFLAANIETCTALTEYDEEKDFMFFENGTSVAEFALKSGDFVVFFSWDIHTPGLAADGPLATVRKVVVKIAV